MDKKSDLLGKIWTNLP